MMQDWLIALSFMVIAFTYAAAGFGGGSSYLAILAVAGLPFIEIRLTALLCNIIVVSGGTLIFIRNRQLNWPKILPLLLMSVPAAFLGAKLRISQDAFFVILGVSLLIAAALLWLQPQSSKSNENAVPGLPLRDGAIGGGIGLLSGMVGIGGGIFLSPVLNFLNWDTARKIAATASVFILVNSLAGLAGQLTELSTGVNWQRVALLGSAVLLGGQLGSRISMARFNLVMIRQVTALLVFIAGIEVLWKHWPL